MRVMVVFVVLALGGCTDTPPVENETGDGGPLPTPNGTTYPREAFGTACEGFGTAFEWLGPNERFDPPPHPGWKYPLADDGPYWTTVLILGFECERFKLGPFERPVRFLVEAASVDAVPEDCLRNEGITVAHYQLESLWFNDTEIVDYLKAVYDLPVHYARIETGRVSVPHGDEYDWVMTHEDGQVSFFRSLMGETSDSSTSHYRFWWWNETALGAFDYSETSRAYGRYTMGQASPPMAMGDWPTDYAGGAAILDEVELDLGFTMYEDFQCQEEVP